MFFFAGFKSKHPIEQAKDRKIIASLNKMKTLRVVGRTLYAEASDFEDAMRKLHDDTRHLVKPHSHRGRPC